MYKSQVPGSRRSPSPLCPKLYQYYRVQERLQEGGVGHDQSVRRSALVNETARRARRSVLERALYRPFIAFRP